MQKRLPNGQVVYEQDYSCIVQPQNGRGGIFIGNLEAAQNIKTLKKHGIRAVLTAAKGIDLTHPKSEVPFYLQVPGEDREGFDLTRYFPQSINFIRDCLDNTNIMVHCLAGVSRSVCLVLAYFIKCKGFSYDEAYNLVKNKRSIIHPNDGFISQLRKYQNQIKRTESPSRYDAPKPKIQSYSISPTKKRYEYQFYNQESVSRNNPQNYQYQRVTSSNYYIAPSSPTKRTLDPYSNAYESPSKKTFQQLIDESYENSQRINSSPLKNRTFQIRQKQDKIIYDNFGNLGLKKLHSYKQNPNISTNVELRHISPQRRRPQPVQQPRGKSISNFDYQTNIQSTESKRLFGNYDRLRHTSAAQLSQQLDSKIAAIRQKYSEYAKNQLSKSRRLTARQPQQKINNFMDQNDLGLNASLGLKRMTSDYQNMKKSGVDFGMIKANLGRTSVVGLGLRKLNSLREGY